MAEKIHANHGRDHLPTGADPIPGLTSAGGAMDWAWMQRTTNLTVNTGSGGIVDNIQTFDTTDDKSGQTSFAIDLTSGTMKILRTGIYKIQAWGQWSGAVPNPSYFSLTVTASAIHPSVPYEYPTFAGTTIGPVDMTTSATVIVTALAGGPPAYGPITVAVGQASGVSRTLQICEIVAVRLSDV